MNLVEFLEARIAEDEAVARAATDGPWTWDEEQAEDESFLYAPGNVAVIVGYGMHTQGFLECSDEDRTHIARHDPARVLAECAAKRAIIKQCREDHEDSLTRNDDTEELASVVLYTLAGVYKDHPDYEQERAL